MDMNDINEGFDERRGLFQNYTYNKFNKTDHSLKEINQTESMDKYSQPLFSKGVINH